VALCPSSPEARYVETGGEFVANTMSDNAQIIYSRTAIGASTPSKRHEGSAAADLHCGRRACAMQPVRHNRHRQ
jgi:hypothetical protein